MQELTAIQDAFAAPLRARAVLLGDRLAVDRSTHDRVVSVSPFCFRKGEGYVVTFRYGAAVLIGLSPREEAETLSILAGNTAAAVPLEEERVGIEVHSDRDEGLGATGIFQIKDLTPAHVLVLADVLGKSVALAHYEKDIASVFDTIEPAASKLAANGRIPSGRRQLLQLVGSALLTQHRVSGRIAFAEKPDILWEHPELERFYARLEDEYEIVERGTLLNGKMTVITTAAQTFTDMMDTARSARLELLIVILILAEIAIAAVALFRP
jgi:required for meiotic nuclear division protein 1